MKKILLSILVALLITLPAFAEEQPAAAFQVLFSGIDNTGGNEGALVPQSNSDANVIITVNTDTKQILLVHIPRDFFVTFSGFGQKDKLCNSGMYGIDTVRNTVSDFIGMQIPYYIRMSFLSFIDYINKMGGIDVDSDFNFSAGAAYDNSTSFYQYTEGENHLNGTQALAFARERKSFSTGDFQRGRDQMKLITAGIKAFTTGSLLNDFQSFLDATTVSYETNVPMSYIVSMLQAQQANPVDWNIVYYNMVGFDSTADTFTHGLTNQYVMEPDMETVEAAKTLMQKVLDGETIAQEDVPLNEADTAQARDYHSEELIKRVQEALNAAGYNCGEPDGKVGPMTSNAIKAFEEANGLSVTGTIHMEIMRPLGIGWD